MKWLIGALVVLFGGLGVWLRRLGLVKESAGPAATGTPEAMVSPVPAATPAPAPREKGKLLATLFLFSDMHISVSDDTMTKKLRLALDDVTALPEMPEAIVFGGDLTDYGRESDYKLLGRILQDYKLPLLYGNMGNHDYYDIWLDKEGRTAMETMPNGKTDGMARQRFMDFMKVDRPYSEARVNGIHLILVSQDLYVQEKKDVGEGAWYSDEQLAWLKKTLEPHADGSPALVFIHQPLPEIGSDGGTHRVIRARAFREILKPYPNVFVFSGHTHIDLASGSHYEKETFHWFKNAAVGRTRGGSGKMAQGLEIRVYEGAVAVRGREFSDKTWIPQADWEIPLV